MERDGSGDYETIQPAVDNAASGDTILIGPGRYTETAPFDPSAAKGWPKPAHIGVNVDELTFIGADRNAVIIGPETANYTPQGPLGFVNYSSASYFELQNVTLENVFNGTYIHGQATIRNCTFRSCNAGIAYWTSGGISVEFCDFVYNTNGISTFTGTGGVVVNSSFSNNIYGCVFIGANNADVCSCDFTSNSVGIDYQQYSSGTVSSCAFDTHDCAIDVYLYSNVILFDNIATRSNIVLYLSSHSNVTGSGNCFDGGIAKTLKISNSTTDLHGNHILNGGGYTVVLLSYANEGVEIVDLTGNYWGTADGETIEGWIWDWNDDPSIFAVVDFEPYASGPIGTEQKSWGGVKELYRSPGPNR